MTKATGAPLELIDDALARLLADATPLTAERVVVDDSAAATLIGRTLAEPLVAAVDHPPVDVSAMDGWVTTAADALADGSRLPRRLVCVGDTAAGRQPSQVPLRRGECQRIATGAPIPPGGETVVPVELSSLEDPGRGGSLLGRVPTEVPAHVWLVESVRAGGNIRRRGEDQRIGRRLADAGETIDPGLLAVIFSSGVAELSVVRRPKVAILATGDEIVDGDSGHGLRDSNSPALAGMIVAEGGEVIARRRVGDTLEATATAVAEVAAEADLVVTTGGVSVGAHDHVGLALAEQFESVVWRIAIQPGKPLLIGRRRPDRDGARWALGLPGNPVSAFVVGMEVLLPLVRALGGRPARALTAKGVLEEPVESPNGKRSFLRLEALRDATGSPILDRFGRVRVRLAGQQGSHQVSVLARTDYLGVVPEPLVGYAAGDEIELHPLPRASHRVVVPNG